MDRERGAWAGASTANLIRGERMVTYWCRTCGALIGRFPGSPDDARLGLASLTPEDRADIIVGNVSDGRIGVRIRCRDCLPGPPPTPSYH
jgi:hypothetical protein